MLDTSRLLRNGTSALVAAGIAFSSLAATAPLALAHDVVMKANPADKSTVSEFPRVIELEFSGVPKDSFNTVAVTDENSGEVLFTESPQLDEQWVRVQVPDSVRPGDGKYKVGFQITSSDGHATRGMTTFEVSGNPSTAATTDENAVSSSESPISNNTYLIIAIAGIVTVAVLLLGLIGLIVMYAKRRK